MLAPLAAIIPQGMVQAYDRAVDIRDFESSPQTQKRLWLRPSKHDADDCPVGQHDCAAVPARVRLRTMKLEDAEAIEWEVIRMLRCDHRRRSRRWTPRRCHAGHPPGAERPESEPLTDPEEWTAACTFEIVAIAGNAAIADWSDDGS